MADSVSVDASQVGDYLDVLHVERGLAGSTIAAYRRDLAQYLAYLDGRAADTEVISGFISDLKERALAPTSIARKVAAVRGFHRFLVSEGTVDTDPTHLAETPRTPQTLPKALTTGEVFRLMAVPDVSSTRGRRDLAILEFLYATAARVSETVGLDELDLDLEEATVVLTGKGNKQRIVPIGAAAVAAVRAWLSERSNLRTAKSGSAVFLSLRGNRISRQSVWTIVRDAGRDAGIDPTRVSPHVLRHSAATHMVEGGADLRSVQELLGHATIATTQIYTRVSPQHLLEVYSTSHPRS